jgi:hypothetical protein
MTPLLPTFYALAADAVLMLHAVVVAFNVAALVLIPLGACRGWAFVRRRWLRVVHLVLMGTVAAQAYLGRACFLTYWEADLAESAGETASTVPLIQRWLTELMYWDVPPWVFVAMYSAALIYSVALWRLVPPASVGRTPSKGDVN